MFDRDDFLAALDQIVRLATVEMLEEYTEKSLEFLAEFKATFA
jgi:hypothetical protein